MGKDKHQRPISFNCIILACSIKPNCTTNPIIKNIQQKYPVQMIYGFPNISVDLELSKNLFIVGTLVILNVGPDCGNVIGTCRAALIMANMLECKSWLRGVERVKPLCPIGSSSFGMRMIVAVVVILIVMLNELNINFRWTHSYCSNAYEVLLGSFTVCPVCAYDASLCNASYHSYHKLSTATIM